MTLDDLKEELRQMSLSQNPCEIRYNIVVSMAAQRAAQMVQSMTPHEKNPRAEILAALPSLINTKTGLMAWVPSVYYGESVVVVSIPTVLHVVKTYNLGEEQDVFRIFGRSEGKEEVAFDEVDIDYSSCMFKEMILTTPFRPGRKNHVNKKFFFVSTADSWRQRFNNPEIGTCKVPASVPSKIGQSYGVGLGLINSKVPELNYFKVEQELQCKIPVFGKEWGVHRFSDAFLCFFHIAKEKAGEVHVVDGAVAE